MLNIAILGFGTVGSGVAAVVEAYNKRIPSSSDDRINIKYILDLREFPGHPLGDRVVRDMSVITGDPDVSVVCEMLGGVHPASEFTAAALDAGKSVVTSNKAVVAACGVELLAKASSNGVRYCFEASVGGGIPLIATMAGRLSGDRINSIAGIVNGTTNFILSRMKSDGCDFNEALAEAKLLGYAEANPTDDIEGIDSCRKICILSAVVTGKMIDYRKVYTEGITKVRPDGPPAKLIARAVFAPDGSIYMAVRPSALSSRNPLSSVDDVYNAVLLECEGSGRLMLYGSGAGSLPTASAVLSDIIDIKNNPHTPNPVWEYDDTLLKTGPISEYDSENGEYKLLTPSDIC